MSFKNILILTVLTIVCGHEAVQAEIIRETTIPDLNITAVRFIAIRDRLLKRKIVCGSGTWTVGWFNIIQW